MERALAVHHGIFGRIAIYRFCAPMVPHAHREGHLTFHLDGPHSNMPVEGQAGPITPETVVACSPWLPHCFEPGSRVEPSTFLVLYISPTWFADLARHVRPGMRFGEHLFYRSQKIRGYVNKLVNLLVLGDRSDLIDGYIYELTQECHDESWRRIEEGTPLRVINDFRVRRSIELMKERVGRTCVIEDVADRSGLSRPHFFKLFRDQTGLTPNVYLNTLRVEQALSDLARIATPVAEIGDDLGFSSQASFSRFFTSHVGLSPTEYRRVANF